MERKGELGESSVLLRRNLLNITRWELELTYQCLAEIVLLSDGDLSVAYEAVFDGADIRREERTFTSEEMHSYLSLEIIMLLGIIQVVRKKEEIV